MKHEIEVFRLPIRQVQKLDENSDSKGEDAVKDQQLLLPLMDEPPKQVASTGPPSPTEREVNRFSPADIEDPTTTTTEKPHASLSDTAASSQRVVLLTRPSQR